MTTDEKIANLEARLTALERPAPVTQTPASGAPWAWTPEQRARLVPGAKVRHVNFGWVTFTRFVGAREESLEYGDGAITLAYCDPSTVTQPSEVKRPAPVADSETAALRAEVARLTAALAAAEAKGRERERADVVAFVQSRDYGHIDVSNYTKHRAIEEVVCDLTTQVERGEHVGASEVRRG